MVKKKVAGLNHCTVLGEVLCKHLKDIAKDWYEGDIYIRWPRSVEPNTKVTTRGRVIPSPSEEKKIGIAHFP